MRNSLLRNDGNGRFTDVTKAAGLANGVFATHSAAWADYDNDGWVDVFVGHELAPSRLYRNRGDGTFEDVSARAGVARQRLHQGRHVGRLRQRRLPRPLRLEHVRRQHPLPQQGRRHVRRGRREARRAEAVRELPDLVVRLRQRRLARSLRGRLPELGRGVRQALPRSAAAGRDADALSQRRARAASPTCPRRWALARVVPAMGANVGDIDNDGFLDVYLGTGAPVLRLADPEHPAAQRRRAPLRRRHRSHRHRAPAEGPRRRLRRSRQRRRPGRRPQRRRRRARRSLRRRALRESGDARPALDRPPADRRHVEPGGDRRQDPGHARRRGASQLRYREVSSGGSFGSNSYVQHVGLGRASAIESIEITWPASKTRQVFRNPPIDTLLEIRERRRGAGGPTTDSRSASVAATGRPRRTSTDRTAARPPGGTIVRDWSVLACLLAAALASPAGRRPRPSRARSIPKAPDAETVLAQAVAAPSGRRHRRRDHRLRGLPQGRPEQRRRPLEPRRRLRPPRAPRRRRHRVPQGARHRSGQPDLPLQPGAGALQGRPVSPRR